MTTEELWGRIRGELDTLRVGIEDRVTTEISALRGDLDTLGGDLTTEISAVRGDLDSLRGDLTTEISAVRGDLDMLRGDLTTEISAVRGDLDTLRGDLTTEVSAVRFDFAHVLRAELGGVRNELRGFRGEFESFRDDALTHFDNLYGRLDAQAMEHHALSAAVARLEKRGSAPSN